MKALLFAVSCGFALLAPSLCQADDLVLVANMSQLQWAEVGGKIYLRNLDQFDPTFQGCCWNYYIDIATDEGKMQWSAVMTRITTGGRLWFGFNTKAAPPGQYVKYIGDWQ